MECYTETFSSFCEENFNNFVSDILITLKKNNKEYFKLCEKRWKLKDNHFKLKLLFDEYDKINSIKLTKNEVKELIKYLDTIYEIHYMELQEMFIAGMREEYYELKRLGIIK